MSGLPAFTLQRPGTVREAASLLAAGARVLAGGTDLLPNLRRGLEPHALPRRTELSHHVFAF